MTDDARDTAAPADALDSPALGRVGLSANPLGQALILTSLALMALGVVLVFSALSNVAPPAEWYRRIDIRQALFAGLALLVMLVLSRVDYHRLAFRHGKIYWPVVLLIGCFVAACLVYVPGIGHAVEHRYRWIRVGPSQYQIQFQPSEVLRLALVIFLAAWLTRPSCNIRSFRTFVIGVTVTVLCVAPVIKEDFGMSLLIILSGLVTLLLAGVPWYYLMGLLPPGAAAFYVMILAKADRMNRMTAMLNPWSTTNPSAYQPQQSLLAVITGGWTGQGLGKGMFKQGYIPEDSTDFIFASFAEEWGFMGSMLLMGLIVMWMYNARKAAVTGADTFGRVLAGSLGAVIAMQMVMHIAVDLVALPPTGMSLPFVSAGGTSLVVMCSAVALMVSVTAARQADSPQARFEAIAAA